MKKRKIRKHPYKFAGRSILNCLLPVLDDRASSMLDITSPRLAGEEDEISQLDPQRWQDRYF